MLKFSDNLLQQSMPAPASSMLPQPPKFITPKPPAMTPPAKPQSFMDNNSFLKTLGSPSEWGTQLSNGFDKMKNSPAVVAGMTENKPPLSFATGGLPESVRGPVDSALGMVQKGLKFTGPQGFAGIMGAAAPGLTKGLLSTPVGLPAMVGLHGLLRGGESAAAANTLFRPLLQKVGL